MKSAPLHAPRRHARSVRAIRGFTLVELTIVTAVMAILVAIALPNYRVFMERTRIDSALSEISNLLAFARTEAIRMRQTVIIEGRSLSTCRTGTDKQDWSCGMVVYIDSNGNGKLDNDEILRERQEFANLIVMHRPQKPMRYYAYGTTDPSLFNITPLSRMTRPASQVAESKTLCVSVGGRTRVLPDVLANCP